MAVYPEKLSGRQEARAACGSQFWEQDVQVQTSILKFILEVMMGTLTFQKEQI